jgi:hypothetical protein
MTKFFRKAAAASRFSCCDMFMLLILIVEASGVFCHVLVAIDQCIGKKNE